MKFFDYQDQYQDARKAKLDAGLSADKWYETMAPICDHLGKNQSERVVHKAMFAADQEWCRKRKPYYNVYPVAIRALKNIRLDIPCESVPVYKCTPIVLRFNQEQPYRTFHSALIAMTEIINWKCHGMYLNLQDGNRTVVDGVQVEDASWVCFPLQRNMTVEESLEVTFTHGRMTDSTAERSDYKDNMREIARLAVAIALLQDNPELVTPDVLADDREKYEATGDEKYVDKAHRRGKVGWNIGAHLDVSPHYRNAHMALRWTGEGRKIPRIVPVKGAIVHRRKVAELPHGYGELE